MRKEIFLMMAGLRFHDLNQAAVEPSLLLTLGLLPVALMLGFLLPRRARPEA